MLAQLLKSIASNLSLRGNPVGDCAKLCSNIKITVKKAVYLIEIGLIIIRFKGS